MPSYGPAQPSRAVVARRAYRRFSLAAVPTLDIGVLFQQSVGGTGTGTGSAGTANSGIRSHDVDVALAHALRGYGACNVVGLPPAAQLHAAS